MSTTSSDRNGDPVGTVVRTLQIIHIALAMGVGVFLAMSVLVLRSGKLFAPDPWTLGASTPLSLIAVLFAVVLLIAHIAVPRAMTQTQRRALARGQSTIEGGVGQSSEPAFLLALYQTQMIVGSALVEGAAFFATIVYFVEGKAIPLILAAGLLALLLSRIPTRSGTEAWLDRQQSLLSEERHLR